MPRSPSPSNTELRLVAVALAVAATACSDDATCGPGTAPADGVALSVGTEFATYGGFTASANNDCTIPGSGVISVSVHGTQVGTGMALTLCLPRPDLLTETAVPLAPSRVPPLETDRVQVIDASATLPMGCTVAIDPTQSPVGTAWVSGYCDGGADPAGYALTITGSVPVRVTCPSGTTSMAAQLSGNVAVGVQ